MMYVFDAEEYSDPFLFLSRAVISKETSTSLSNVKGHENLSPKTPHSFDPLYSVPLSQYL